MEHPNRRALLGVLGGGAVGATAAYLGRSRSANGGVAVQEAFFTPDRGDDIDTPAVWHGDGAHLLLVTAKGSHELVVFDATEGTYLRSIGGHGSGLGEFDRPNAVFVIDDLAIVVERDNRRVQILSMPDGEPVGTFGEDQLRRPYGCTAYVDDGEYVLFVTDDYEASDPAAFDERVKQYRFTVEDGALGVDHVAEFGATTDPGALRTVESIYADPEHRNLLIADEAEYAIKLYDLDGNFLDIVTSGFGENDPEGITLHREEGAGRWVFTEQDQSLSKFHLFDRESFEYLTTFSGGRTANTDGVWLTQREFGPFEFGAFYAVHDDREVAAFDWEDVVRRTDGSTDTLSNTAASGGEKR